MYTDDIKLKLPFRYYAAPEVPCVREVYVSGDAAKALFILDDRMLQDTGIERSEIWSAAIVAVERVAAAERFKKASETEPSKPSETARDQDFMPEAA